MRAAIIIFPGSNCDRDLATAFEQVTGHKPQMVWHKEAELPAGIDLIGLPGGFSYGDYLRCGAMAARAPICKAVADFAARGGYVLGICNGFQILTEIGLLPGALMRNANLRFICKPVDLIVENAQAPFLSCYRPGMKITLPIAHHDGNYQVNTQSLARLNDDGRIAFRYANNPNGSEGDIAGILSENCRVLGMMPHPERAVDPLQGGKDGAALFSGLIDAMATS